ncbi:MAG TPA: CGNR zinc finger domain-containing protein [Micromonosporaceae bacterium]|jgi:predicted RNA-binding Zn ribbon-like protein
MLFAHDTELGLDAAVGLVNTDSSDGDTLTDVPALAAFLERYGWSGRFDRTPEELRSVRDLRPRLRGIWDADEDGVTEIVNGLLREYHALPQLVRHDREPYHMHATAFDAPLVDRMAVEAAMAFLDVVRSGELDRLHVCALPTCGDVLIDLSKNRSKRFCDVNCGNKAAVTAYRARKAAGSHV